MKKTILLSLALTCYSLIYAADTKLFTGETTPEAFSRMDMVGWAMGEIKDAARYVNFGTVDAPAFTRITDNPDKTGVNTTNKVLQLTSLKGHSWWPDFLNLDVAAPITITAENRYLHIYMYRENLNQGFSVNINRETPWDADKGTKRWDMNLAAAGKWEDVVVDLKWFMDNAEALKQITVLMDMNWGGAAEPVTNYYFDEIALNNNPLPRGVTILTDTQMSLFFGNTASYAKWVKNLDLQHPENTSAIVANPFTTQTAVLNSTSVLKFNKSANASWWQSVRVVMPGILPVGVGGVPTYLHAMINIADMPISPLTPDYYVVQLNAKDYTGKELDSGDALKYWVSDKGTWVDLVLDVSSLGYVQEFTVRFDLRRDAADVRINSPAGVFYLDAIAINGNADPRTAVVAPTSVTTVKDNGIKVFAKDKNIRLEGTASQISVYNSIGKLVTKITSVTTNTTIPVTQSGVYLVNTLSLTGANSISKVLIK
jgi:hypothetical protein